MRKGQLTDGRTMYKVQVEAFKHKLGSKAPTGAIGVQRRVCCLTIPNFINRAI